MSIIHQFLQPSLHGCIRSDNCCAQSVLHRCFFNVTPKGLHRIDRRQQFKRLAPNQSQKTLLGSSEQSLSCSVCARCNHRHRNKQIRVLQFLTRLELQNPYLLVAVPVIAASTDAAAQRLFTAPQQRFLRLIRGESLELLPPVDSMEPLWSDIEKA